jgi:hypothetical protein
VDFVDARFVARETDFPRPDGEEALEPYCAIAGKRINEPEWD